MSDNEAKDIANAVVDWLYNNGKIPESVYGKMTMDGDGADAEAIAQVIKQTYDS